MIELAARWDVAPSPERNHLTALASELRVPETLAALLVLRGYATPDAAKAFLRPDLDALADPAVLPDMGIAVDRIAAAVRAGRTIMVHGDYDVDGQCGTALLTRALRAAGARVVPFVPHRILHGYDFGPAGLAAAQAAGVDLIVTCDCGTTAIETVRQAKAAGITVIVTDHHEVGELPPADAVVNPRRTEEGAPLRDLCGTGVAFKLVQALVPVLGLPRHLPLHLLDLVALATVADIVSLTGENRVLVRHGLKMLADSRWLGLRALVAASGLSGQPIRAGHVGFILAPRLNAAGRIGNAMDGLALLLTDDPEEARRGALALETINAERQAIDQRILEEAVEEIQTSIDLQEEYGLVLARETWHPGVIGIVASRIVERYARPTILIALEGAEGRGSGRSIPGFDLHGALRCCAPHLARFGGHRMAAGLSVTRDRLPAFRAAFNAVAREKLTPGDLVPRQRIDALVPLERIDGALERLLRHLEPCGSGNPAPVFGVRGAWARAARPVGEAHLRFTIDDGTASLQAIGFGWADRVAADWASAPVDVAFRVEQNEWHGTTSLQARVVQIRPST